MALEEINVSDQIVAFKRSLGMRFWYAFDRVRAGEVTLPRQQLLYIIQASPSGV
jgi:hypothetical protein